MKKQPENAIEQIVLDFVKADRRSRGIPDEELPTAADLAIEYPSAEVEEQQRRYKQYNNINPNEKRFTVTVSVDIEKYPEFKQYGLNLYQHLGISEAEYYQLDFTSILNLIEQKRRKPYEITRTGSIERAITKGINNALRGKKIRSDKDTKYTYSEIIETLLDENNKPYDATINIIEVRKPGDKRHKPFDISYTPELIGLNKRDTTTMKLWQLILSESNRQNNPTLVSFDPDKLVELGMYKTRDAALKALDKSVPKLMTWAVALRGKNARLYGFHNVFSDYVYRGGTCYFKTNELIPLRVIAPYCSFFPLWGYSLSGRAYSLLYYIMSQSTQQKQSKDVYARRAFDVKIEKAAEIMLLPHPDDTTNPDGTKNKDGTKNPGRDIVEEIREAVEEILTAQRRAGLNEIAITEVIDERHKDGNGEPIIRLYYSNAYLKIECSGLLLDWLNNRTEKIEAKKEESKAALEAKKARAKTPKKTPKK